MKASCTGIFSFGVSLLKRYLSLSRDKQGLGPTLRVQVWVKVWIPMPFSTVQFLAKMVKNWLIYEQNISNTPHQEKPYLLIQKIRLECAEICHNLLEQAANMWPKLN